MVITLIELAALVSGACVWSVDRSRAGARKSGLPDEALVPLGHERRFVPLEQMSVVTEHSIWLIQLGSYLRTPRDEQPRPQEPSHAGRLDDGRWHRYRTAWWFGDTYGLRVRLLPAVGPRHGQGIYTGLVVEVHGPWRLVPRRERGHRD